MSEQLEELYEERGRIITALVGEQKTLRATIDRITAERDAMAAMLTTARAAIAALPMKAMGYAENNQAHWPIRDELLHRIDTALSSAPAQGCCDETEESRAKATEGKAGMAVGEAHVRRSTAGTGLRVGEADAVQPATSEFMDVTAGETAPLSIIEEALHTYDEWMLDDCYDSMSILHKIMRRMRERATVLAHGHLPAPPSTDQGGEK